MYKEEFLKKVALTLEVSLNMADEWLERIEPSNEEEKKRLEDYKAQVDGLLKEVREITQEKHTAYEVAKLQEKVEEVVENVEEKLSES